MNFVFLAIALFSLYMLTKASPESVMPALLGGVNGGVALALKLFAVYAIWLSVLKIFEQAGIDRLLAEKLKKITGRLFKDESPKAHVALTLNLSANLLGMGGAATPMGLKAMEEMRRKKNKIMLVVINSTSIQLIPTTIVAIRATFASTADIILPSIIATFITTALAVVLVNLLVK